MKKKIIILVFLILIICGVLLFLYIKNHKTNNELTLYGNIEIRQVDLSFQVAGKIEKMLKEEGDTVKPGELLAIMDSRDYDSFMRRLAGEFVFLRDWGVMARYTPIELPQVYYFDDEFVLDIGDLPAGVDLIYTLDGSDPRESSTAKSYKSERPRVKKSCVLTMRFKFDKVIPGLTSAPEYGVYTSSELKKVRYLPADDPQLLAQPLHGQGLEHIADDVVLDGLLGILKVVIAAEEGDIGGRPHLPHLPGQLDAGDKGHPDIGEQQVRLVLLHQLQCVQPVAGAPRQTEAQLLPRYHGAHRLSQLVLVVGDNHRV